MCENCPLNNNGICKKTGEQVGKYHCENVISDNHIKEMKKKKRLTGREKKEKYKDYMRKLYGYDLGYPAPVYIRGDGRGYIWDNDFDFHHLPDRTFYKRVYRGRNYTKNKRRSHKAVRQYKEIIADGNSYKKLYNLWWITF